MADYVKLNDTVSFVSCIFDLFWIPNAPNYLLGFIIQKRYTSFQDCHVYDKGGFTGASRCNFYATKAWNLNNCENSSSNSTTVSNLMIKSRAGSCTYK